MIKNVPQHKMSDAELYRCVLFQTPVLIHEDADDQRSKRVYINAFNDDFLFVDNGFYFRNDCSLERIEVRTDYELYNSLFFQQKLEVKVNNITQSYVTKINTITEDVIFTDSGFYFRSEAQMLLA